MAMLYADSAEFRERYPHSVKLYDADGSRIASAIACDPETGDVIEAVKDEAGLFQVEPGIGLLRRTTRYPAPLTIVANDPPAGE